MQNILELIGPQLLSKNGTVKTVEALNNVDIIGLYFSSSWCPPCKEFTPVLTSFYKKCKDSNSSFEIIFVSSDKCVGEYDDFFHEMTWLSLPYADRERKARLSKKFKVQGIPNLVILDAKIGELISSNGRSDLMEDPDGNNFPWYPTPLPDLLKGTISCHTGDRSLDESIKGKVKGLFFSAHWCPPCRSFLPVLVEIYQKLQDQNKKFEIIFLSSDRSEDSYEEYYSTMPWLAFPFGDPRIPQLTKHFNVQGIPCLILLDENNELITKNGRAILSKDIEAKNYPWFPSPLNELTDVTAPLLNESACLIFFTDSDSDHITHAKSVMPDIASRYTEEQKKSRNSESELPELCFLYEGLEGEEVVESLRSFANLEDRIPLVALVDIPEQQIYVLPDAEITADSLQVAVNKFKEFKIPYVSLQSDG